MGNLTDHGFSLALLDSEGNAVAAHSSLIDWTSLQDRMALVANVASAPNASYGFAQNQHFGSSILSVAKPESARFWHGITHELLQTAIEKQCYIVCGIDGDAVSRRFSKFAAAFGWSPAVSRTVESLYIHCDVRAAARHSGISFHTARENLKIAREAIGAPNLPMLVMLLNVTSTGLCTAGDESSQLLAEIFDLTERQLRVADNISNGATRAATAREFGLSEALVKKEMAAVFDATGVTNAIGLARLMSEARAVSIFTNYTQNGRPFPAPYSKTITLNSGARKIVASDYGPEKGKPVLVLHSSMTTRSTNRQLVEALQDAGFRPLSLDRPGFGDTDNIALEDNQQKGPFHCAAGDMVSFCKHMQFASVDIVTRGAAQVALAFHEVAPQLIRRAVVINPDPDSASSSKREGRMGAIKNSFAKRPWAVEAMARFIVVLSTYDRTRESMLKAVASSECDTKVMADEANIAEYYRGIKPYHKGSIQGFINEQVALATCGKPMPVKGTQNFRLIIGESDFLHDAQGTADYWRDVLPDAEIRILEGAGRFLAYSHADHVVAALKKAD